MGLLFFIVFVLIIPVAGLVWVGALIHKLWVPDNSISCNLFIITTLCIILYQILDCDFIYWVTRQFDAFGHGDVGAVLGDIFLSPIPGLLYSLMIGAVCAELIGRKTRKGSSKAGLGTIIGRILAFLSSNLA